MCPPTLSLPQSTFLRFPRHDFTNKFNPAFSEKYIIIVHYSPQIQAVVLLNSELQQQKVGFWCRGISHGMDPWCGMLVGGQRGAMQQPAGAQGPPGSCSPALSLQERVSVLPNLTAFHLETCLSYQRQPISFNLETAFNALRWSVVWVLQLKLWT